MPEASSSRVPGLGEDSEVTVEVDDLEILDFDQLAGQLIEDACEDVGELDADEDPQMPLTIRLPLHVTVSPSPQSKDEENEKLHKLREYARDFRRQHTTDAEQFDWDSDDGDYGLAIGRLVVT
jgi:hypothetical protein